MTEYARPLWLGGGISYDALEIVERVLRNEAEQNESYTPTVNTELVNLANSVRAEILRRPRPECDLI